MAPQRPESKHRRGDSSGTPSPTKTSPRKSGDKRRSRDPEKRTSQQAEKRKSAASGRDRDGAAAGAPAEQVREKRRSAPSSPRKSTPRRASPTKRRVEKIVVEYESSTSGSNLLSTGALAKLDALNTRGADPDRHRGDKKSVTGRVMKERIKHKTRRRDSHGGGEKRKTRVASGNTLEKGVGRRGGYLEQDSNPNKRKKLIYGAILLGALILVIAISVGVVVGRKKSGGTGAAASATPGNGNLNGISQGDIPTSAKGGYLDPFTWYDTTDFNVTYTAATTGGLPVMGLNSTWDDTKRANKYVPPLNEKFNYGKMPIRGVNIGGWLSLEPFITPSLFNYDSKLGIVDEYTLTQHLGTSEAAKTLEKHYSSFINKQSFLDIQAAGFDHVRIPFSYWAVVTYAGDPYVPKISWRYLLRGIEYARECGIRVNLDLHGLPGSQNGWNHSGRQGVIGWLNGTDGTTNGQRSLDIHGQLSTFFAQPRYKNVIGIYGLVNEPKMITLVTATVIAWTESAITLVRQNGITQWIAFGDGFLGLPNWKGKLQGINNLVMDAHQYVIFNNDQLAFDHKTKLNYACAGWNGQMSQSVNTASGFGPTMCGEWSQADTDCASNLNNVGTGSRWTGTLNLPDPSLAVLKPQCPAQDSSCSCDGANANPSSYSDSYKQWLLYNAEAQMNSFEVGLGWFYWTWLTEDATQWSWKLGMAAGILPDKVWDREFNCSQNVPSFTGLPETY